VLLSRKSTLPATAAALVLTLALAACGGSDKKTTDAKPGASSSAVQADGKKLSGTINGDGSSTVFPIMEGVAEDFGKASGVKINVGESGTGGGFEKFCNGETDFSNASRPIKDAEIAKCKAKGVEYEEFKIASDGLSVVTNSDVKVDCLSFDDLKKTFTTGSTVKKFSDIKAGLPAQSIKIFMPGSDSGTYDFFLQEVLGKDGKFRTDDVTASEDDNVLVQGIEGSKGGVGFFGFAYYEQNKDRLNLVGVDKAGKGCVKPSVDTVRDASYALSRPLFVYVKKEAYARPEVKEMLKFVVGDKGRAIISEVGYVQLEDADYQSAQARLGS
jgi:phosphate transport system substrate-binding protein